MNRMKKFIFTCILLLTASLAVMAGDQFTLVVDAGHGGHDPGAKGAFSNEKDINLNVALAFGKLVEDNCKGVKVIYTRKTDVFVELNERANIANRNKANLFISVHTNAVPKGRIARGFETYTLGMARANENLDVAKRENSVITYEKNYSQKYEGFNPNSAESYIMFEFMQDKNMSQSVELAKEIQRSACNSAGRIDKGVHQAGFLVLRKTSMPSCLIELGFISTRDEEEFLNTPEGVNSLARGIFNAFVKYRNKYDKSIVVPYQVQEEITSPFVATESKQPAQQPKPAVKEEEKKPVAVKKPTTIKDLPTIYEGRDGIYFRVQLFATKRMLRPGAEQFKGESGIDFYQEDDYFKYTIGDSPDYDEVSGLCKKMKSKFPEAYVIAIKNGKKMFLNDAVTEYRKNKKQ